LLGTFWGGGVLGGAGAWGTAFAPTVTGWAFACVLGWRVWCVLKVAPFKIG
jgi:hypothetical protein